VEREARQYPRETALLRCDALALSLRKALERIVPALAGAAAVFVDAGGWRSFGYARAGDHARERFGRSGRWLRDLAALGTALEKLPGLADAVGGASTGADACRSIGRVAASIIGRVATPESLQAWVEAARSVPVRTLREMAARARREGSVWPPPEAVPADAAVSAGTTLIDNDTAPSPCDRHERSRRHTESDAVGSAGPSASDAHSTSRSSPLSSPSLDDISDTDEAARGVLVRLLVPAAVTAAFDEALELYRALAGSQTSVTEFVEALVADAQAGPYPADAHAAPLGLGHARDEERFRALREKALARSTENWKHLVGNTAAATDWAFALAGMSLAALEDVCSRAGRGSPVELDTQIRTLIGLEDELERSLARLLADMADQNAWARLRFDSVGHYAEQRLGMSRSAAQDRVRAQRGLARLSVVNKAYQRGDIGLCAALTLVRVLERGGSIGQERQRAWVRRAQLASVKRLRDEECLMGRLRGVGRGTHVAGALNGIPTPHDPDLIHVLEGNPSSYEVARDRELAAHCMPLDDAAWQRSLRREPGTARHRIAIFGSVALENPQDDSFFRLRLPADLAAGFLSSVESARARLARRVEEVPWDQPWPGEGEPDAAIAASLLCARMFSIRCRRSPAWVGLLALLEEFVQTWDDPQLSPARHCDAVYIRDGWRCTAPGCTSRRNLENHHIMYRSRGGSDELFNLTCLCRFHHQLGEHGGLSSCRGAAPLGIVWALGRDGAGGRWKNEIRIN
jgi:hypothetical protein